MVKKMRFLLLITSLFSIFSPCYSQHAKCGIEERMIRMAGSDSVLLSKMDNARKRVFSRIENNTMQKNGEKRIIPVVFHVVWNRNEGNISDEKILEQFEIMNSVFSSNHEDLDDVPLEFQEVIGSPNIKFCLALEDSNGNSTNGIVRNYTTSTNIGNTDSLFFSSLGGSSAWDTKQYLNIWVVENLNNAGYAIFPWMATDDIDGFVLSANEVLNIGKSEQDRGRVAIHEIGHYLGLSHIWGDDLFHEDENCINDDGFSDTPLQWTWNYQCPREGNDRPFSCGSNDMYVNFMDYSPDNCLHMFTKQQSEFMLATIEEYRSELTAKVIRCTGDNEITNPTILGLYPNPSNGIITLKITNETSAISNIQIFNTMGQVVMEKKEFIYDGISIDLSILKPGVYLLRIQNSTHKIIIV